jgi:hypothetical protein
VDNNKIAVIRAALLQTTSTTGWGIVKSFANSLVQNTVVEALDEEDPIKGEAKRLKASALRRGFKDLFTAIETAKNIDGGDFDDAGLGELEKEEGVKHG